MADTPEQNPLQGEKVPKETQDKLKRGRDAIRKDANLRRLCLKFWRGDQNWYLNAKGGLSFLPNALIHPQKQPHRIRDTYRFIHSIVESKVSAATQRVPGYEITPSTGDPQDIAASRLAGQFAPYLYDKIHLRRATSKLVTNAIVQREGFARAYFDPNVGPFLNAPKPDPETGLPSVVDGQVETEQVGMGEIKVMILTRSEVGWEPAEDFEDSRWYMIERATVVDEIEKMPGFYGGKVKADAETRDIPTERKSDQMAVLTEYLERPCPDYPRGRRLFICNDKVICPEEGYPVEDPDGEVLDEPPAQRLSYTVDPEGDDRGLVEHLIDLARTIDDCWNKLREWKNRCLMPQMSAPKGSNVSRRDDTPGATWYYNLVGGVKPEWERTPPVPQELFQMLEAAKADMRAIAADLNIEPGPNVAARTVNAAVEQAAMRWQSFLGDLAEVHSRLMRSCLTLAARHYSEKRQVEIRGQYGWEPLDAFTGQDLRSQVNVRVLPGSIETKTRQAILDEITFIQTNWPGFLRPEVAMAALHGGNTDAIFRSYDLHVARANDLIKRLRENPDSVMSLPPRLDLEMGDPMMGFRVPGWMPRKQDNVVIWKQVIGDYMVTPDFFGLPPDIQHLFDQIWDGLEMYEQRRAMQIAMQTQNVAADQGAQNAAKPQGQIPLPQQNGMTPEQAAPEALTPA